LAGLDLRDEELKDEHLELDDFHGEKLVMTLDTAWTTGLIFGMRLAGASRFLPLSGYTRA